MSWVVFSKGGGGTEASLLLCNSHVISEAAVNGSTAPATTSQHIPQDSGFCFACFMFDSGFFPVSIPLFLDDDSLNWWTHNSIAVRFLLCQLKPWMAGERFPCMFSCPSSTLRFFAGRGSPNSWRVPACTCIYIYIYKCDIFEHSNASPKDDGPYTVPFSWVFQ